MGIEIERKFLVTQNVWRDLGLPVPYKQGYLVSDGKRTVRVRLAGDHGFITIKGPTTGASRSEYEYEIPADEAMELFDLCALPIIEKFRTEVIFDGKLWEVDEFLGENHGLVIAEIELTSEDESFNIPPWIGDEVTSDRRYYNSQLALNPYIKW
jgi:adenylate cyclase